MNQSKLKLEGNIIGYMCESSLDGWNHFTHNININTIAIDTYEPEDDLFVLSLNSNDIPPNRTYARLAYDTKKECLADRDKLLNWLIGLDSNPSK